MREVRVVAPSMSLEKKDKIKLDNAKKYFEKLGYSLSFGKYVFEKDKFYGCASIQNRVQDLMEAFLDKNVKVIVCATGGYNVNQILPYLDYEIIRENPKILIGYSDITALLLAIYTKTGLMTYYGPMIKGFGRDDEYIFRYFEKALRGENFKIESSSKIYDYKKINNEYEDVVLDNKGMTVIQEGKTSGVVVGGNLCTFNLLQGTEFMPNLNGCILFLEDDADDYGNDVFLQEFDRNLESLLQVKGCQVKGVVFGRFQLCSNMTLEKLIACVKNKEKLKDVPIVCGVDFGHTYPMITLPIGASCSLEVSDKKIEIEIQMVGNKDC